ncbi:unnamed protein product [Paramecium pentaurelia]|uniref:Major facilitator superfamily (MFS) profile domain-containing protein n=1 Tax=Paramecium pentaurelia TaxID=43138 RepID=A0A8S1WX56_9CILI|nr:unnamed protein product [Paramecium pentaurelia]
MSKTQAIQFQGDLQPQYTNKTKWGVLFAFCYLAFSNVLGFVSYSPISNNAANYYQISLNDLFWIGNMYYITFFIFGPLFIPLLEKRLDLCLKLASILTTLGTWIVWVAQSNYVVCLIGYFFVGISEAFYLGVPVYLSEVWFTAYDRTLATCFGSYATLSGIMISYTYSSFYFFGIEEQHVVDDKINNLNLIIAILNSLSIPICFILIKYKNQLGKLTEENNKFFSQFFNIFQKEEFFLDLLAFSIFIGISWVYISVISLQLYIFGFTQLEVGITGIFFTGSGILAGIWCSFKLDQEAKQGKQPNYDIFIKITTLIGFFAILLEAFTIQYLSIWALILLNIFNGIGLNVIYPLAIEAFVEKLYPIKSLIVATWVFGFANLLGFALNYLLILPVIMEYGLWLTLAILTPFELYFILFYKSRYRRFELSN